MSNKISLFLFLFIVFFCNAQGIKYKITYKETVDSFTVIDSIKLPFPIKFPKHSVIGVLEGNNSKAFYRMEKDIEYHEKLSKKEKLEQSFSILFKDFKNNKLIHERTYPNTDKPVALKTKLNIFSWTLKNESKKIAGFNCKKAIGVDKFNQRVTCWYTDDLNIIGAPYEYDGLPGLVVFVLVDDKPSITYELLKVEYPNKINFPTPNNNIKFVSEEQFRKKQGISIETKTISIIQTHH